MSVFLRLAVVLALALTQGQAAEGTPDDMSARRIRAAQDDVDRAVRELNALRDSVAKKRAPLAQELATLEHDVSGLRAEARRLRALRQQDQMEHQVLTETVTVLEDEVQFLTGALLEYRRSLETRVGVAEARLLTDKLLAVDELLGEHNDPEALPSAARALFDLAADWTRSRLGGAAFDGECLDAAGTVHHGRFAVMGPVTFFAASDAPVAGLVVGRVNSAEPSLALAQQAWPHGSVETLTAGGRAALAFDVTSGDVLKMQQASQSLVGHLKDGGFVMIPLLGIGILAFLLVLGKAVSLQGIGEDPTTAIERVVGFLASGQATHAESEARNLKDPLGAVLLAGIEYRDAPKEHLEEIMHERVLASIPTLDRHLGTLAVLGGVAPLLGLLGTVTGMIHTFQMVTAFGTGEARLLSGGISEALVTTEVGLVIAIPVVLAHAYLSRRVRTLVGVLEHTVVRFVHLLKLQPESK